MESGSPFPVLFEDLDSDLVINDSLQLQSRTDMDTSDSSRTQRELTNTDASTLTRREVVTESDQSGFYLGNFDDFESLRFQACSHSSNYDFIYLRCDRTSCHKLSAFVCPNCLDQNHPYSRLFDYLDSRLIPTAVMRLVQQRALQSTRTRLDELKATIERDVSPLEEANRIHLAESLNETIIELERFESTESRFSEMIEQPVQFSLWRKIGYRCFRERIQGSDLENEKALFLILVDMEHDPVVKSGIFSDSPHSQSVSIGERFVLSVQSFVNKLEKEAKLLQNILMATGSETIEDLTSRMGNVIKPWTKFLKPTGSETECSHEDLRTGIVHSANKLTRDSEGCSNGTEAYINSSVGDFDLICTDFSEQELPVNELDLSIFDRQDIKQKYDDICLALSVSAPGTREGFIVRTKIADIVKLRPDSLLLNALYAVFLYAYIGPSATVEVIQTLNAVKDHSLFRKIIAIIQCSQQKYEEAIQEFYASQGKGSSGLCGGESLLPQAISRKAGQDLNMEFAKPNFQNRNPFLSPENIQQMFACFASSSRVKTPNLNLFHQVLFRLEAASLWWLESYDELVLKCQEAALTGHPYVLYSKGVAFHELGNFNSSRELFVEAYKEEPSEVYLLTLLKSIATEESGLEQIQLLKNLCDEFEDLNSSSDIFHMYMGFAQEQLSQYEGAMQSYDYAIRIRRSTFKDMRSWDCTEFRDHDPWLSKARVYKYKNDLNGFLYAYERAIESTSRDKWRRMLYQVINLTGWKSPVEVLAKLNRRYVKHLNQSFYGSMSKHQRIVVKVDTEEDLIPSDLLWGDEKL